MTRFKTALLKVPALLFFAISLLACQADIEFTVEQKLDRRGNDYATLTWDVQPFGSITPSRVTLEPGFGDVDFSGSVDVFPTETTEYTLTVYAEYEDGGIANTVRTDIVYVGPWVDYDLFTDTNFRACLEEAGYTHIEQFISVVCTDRNINSIAGIEQLTDAQVVTLDLNNISDLSPLAGLNKVHTLSITNNNLTDISSLPTLPLLTNLVLFNNAISDVSALALNPQLLNLAINDNQIADTQQFAPLVNLTNLTVANNNIVDISGLGVLTALEVLNARNNRLDIGVWDLRFLESAYLIDLRDNPDVNCLEYANLIVILGTAVLFNDCSFFPPEEEATP
ncbi:MAG: hypothetical protein MI867_17760 [Pseudomonadales bacterium]|nr:hypothetical protein [Pseudomonadales bacterium]